MCVPSLTHLPSVSFVVSGFLFAKIQPSTRVINEARDGQRRCSSPLHMHRPASCEKRDAPAHQSQPVAAGNTIFDATVPPRIIESLKRSFFPPSSPYSPLPTFYFRCNATEMQLLNQLINPLSSMRNDFYINN